MTQDSVGVNQHQFQHKQVLWLLPAVTNNSSLQSALALLRLDLNLRTSVIDPFNFLCRFVAAKSQFYKKIRSSCHVKSNLHRSNFAYVESDLLFLGSILAAM